MHRHLRKKRQKNEDNNLQKIDELKEQLECLRDETKNEQQAFDELNALHSRRFVMNKNKKTNFKDHDELIRQYDILLNEKEHIKKRYNGLYSKHCKLRKECDNMLEKCGSTTFTASDYTKIDNLSKEIETMTHDFFQQNNGNNDNNNDKLHEKYAKLQMDHAEGQNRIKALQHELASTRAMRNECSDMLGKYSAAMSNDENDHREIYEKYKNLQMDHRESQNRIKALHRELETMTKLLKAEKLSMIETDSKYDNLSKEIQTMKNDLFQQNNDKLHEKHVKLQMDHAESQNRIKALQRELASTRTMRNECSDVLGKYSAAMSNDENGHREIYEKYKNLQMDHAESQNRIKALHRELDTMTNLLKAEKSSMTETDSKYEELHSMYNRKNNVIGKKLAKSQQQNAEYLAIIRDLKKHSTKYQTKFDKDKDSKQQIVQLLEKELASLKNQNEIHSALRSKYNALIGEHKDCKQKYDDLRYANEQIIAKYHDLQRQNDDLFHLADEYATDRKVSNKRMKAKKALSNDVIKSERGRLDNSLRSTLNDERAKNELMGNMMNESRQIIASMEEKMNALKSQNEELSIKCNVMMDKRDELQSEYRTVIGCLEAFKKESNEEIRSLNAQLAKAHNASCDNAKFEQIISDLQMRYDELLKFSDVNEAKYKNGHNEWKQECDKLFEQNRNLQRQNDDLNATMTRKEADTKYVNERLENVKAEHDKVKKMNESLQSELSIMTEKLADFSTNNASSLQAKNQIIEKQQIDNDVLQKMMTENEQNFNALKEQIIDLKEEKNKMCQNYQIDLVEMREESLRKSEGLRIECMALQAKNQIIEKQQTDNAVLQKMMNENERNFNALKQQIIGLKKENNDLMIEKNKMSQNYQIDLAEMREESRRKCEGLRIECMALKEQNEQSKIALVKMERKMNENMTNKECVDVLKRQWEIERHRLCANHRINLDKMRIESREHSNASNAENEELRRKNGECMNKIVGIESQISALNAEYGRLKCENEQLKKQNANGREDRMISIEKYENALHEMKKEFKDSRAQFIEMCNNMKKMTVKNEKYKVAIDQYQQIENKLKRKLVEKSQEYDERLKIFKGQNEKYENAMAKMTQEFNIMRDRVGQRAKYCDHDKIAAIERENDAKMMVKNKEHSVSDLVIVIGSNENIYDEKMMVTHNFVQIGSSVFGYDDIKQIIDNVDYEKNLCIVLNDGRVINVKTSTAKSKEEIKHFIQTHLSLQQLDAHIA